MTERTHHPGEPVTPEELATVLRAATANLTGWIEARAAELAAGQVAAVRADAEERVRMAQLELTRREDVVAELRRQYAAQHRQTAELRWAGRYLPAPIRRRVLGADPSVPGHFPGDRPPVAFMDAIDAAAAACGLTPYPPHDTAAEPAVGGGECLR